MTTTVTDMINALRGSHADADTAPAGSSKTASAANSGKLADARNAANQALNTLAEAAKVAAAQPAPASRATQGRGIDPDYLEKVAAQIENAEMAALASEASLYGQAVFHAMLGEAHKYAAAAGAATGSVKQAEHDDLDETVKEAYAAAMLETVDTLQKLAAATSHRQGTNRRQRGDGGMGKVASACIESFNAGRANAVELLNALAQR